MRHLPIEFLTQISIVKPAKCSDVLLSMGETDPPAAINADSTRGVAYYEKLKRDLRETLTRKKLLDKDMVHHPLIRFLLIPTFC